MSDERPKATSRKGVSTIFPEALMALQDTIAKEVAEVDGDNMPLSWKYPSCLLSKTALNVILLRPTKETLKELPLVGGRIDSMQ